MKTTFIGTLYSGRTSRGSIKKRMAIVMPVMIRRIIPPVFEPRRKIRIGGSRNAIKIPVLSIPPKIMAYTAERLSRTTRNADENSQLLKIFKMMIFINAKNVIRKNTPLTTKSSLRIAEIASDKKSSAEKALKRFVSIKFLAAFTL
jgi:hypothetical protein